MTKYAYFVALICLLFVLGTLFSSPIGLSSSNNVHILYFKADWCSQCHRFERDTLSDPTVRYELSRFQFQSIDIDKNKDLARKYQIMGVPTIIIVKKGRIEARIIGYKSPNEFIYLLKGY